MGNVLRFLCGKCGKPEGEGGEVPSHPPAPQYLGPHGVTLSTVGTSALAQDILHFDVTSQVPVGLDRYVVSSKEAQAKWYRKLSAAWKEAKPPPRDPESASRLVVLALKRHRKADVEGLLRYYGLPYIDGLVGLTGGVPSSWPEGVRFQFETLPVDAKAVADGDTVTVYVDTSDPRESSNVPIEVQEAAIRRETARASRNFQLADALQEEIKAAGYRVIKGPNKEEILAKKYRIRLRGIDAPESKMPYGREAKEELLKLVEGRSLKVQVYDVDRYSRHVADLYCNDIFIQEVMLKRGFAWHYVAYDKRPELAMWEQEARAARRGLWTLKDPEKPWEWRKNRRNGT